MNLKCFKVLSSRDLDMMPSIRHLLKMLAAFDAVFLVFTLTLFCISAWSEDYNLQIRPWLPPYFLPGNFEQKTMLIMIICKEKILNNVKTKKKYSV